MVKFNTNRSHLLLLIYLVSWINADCPIKLSGPIGDVDATVEQVDQTNNFEILPRLKSILDRDYFHYFEVNLERGCPFFSNDLRCNLKDCSVRGCPMEDVPSGLRSDDVDHRHEKPQEKYSEALNKPVTQGEDELECQLSKLDSSLSEERKTILGGWSLHDAMNELNFYDPDDQGPGKLVWVDLLKNPERFTGYKGVASNKIWHMVHAENCFNDGAFNYQSFSPSPESLQCLEKRAFYRMVSGLHSSITIHLCYRYPKNLFTPNNQLNSGSKLSDWGPNADEFHRRFNPQWTPESTERLRNLYFAYLVELRALVKVAPYLRTLKFYTGDTASDGDTKRAIGDFLNVIESKGNLFDESMLFADNSEETLSLKNQFRQHFYNISRIMDCVGCEKCRLWGKLQTQGMGTALKILFTPPNSIPTQPEALSRELNFQLSRREIVALFNAFGRLATSIGAFREFCPA